MFTRYRCCSENRLPVVTTTCCPPARVPDSVSAMPESVRMQIERCTPYIRTGPTSFPCVGGPGSSTGSVVIGTTDAPVQVRSVAASETTRLRGVEVLNQLQNIDNPDTRFQQYFPKQPIAPERVLCPERLPPSNAPRGPAADRGCVPQNMFAPSVPQTTA
jgi:hypothetical protein